MDTSTGFSSEATVVIEKGAEGDSIRLFDRSGTLPESTKNVFEIFKTEENYLKIYTSL